MDPAVILALISELYAQLGRANARVTELERLLTAEQPGDRDPEWGGKQQAPHDPTP